MKIKKYNKKNKCIISKLINNQKSLVFVDTKFKGFKQGELARISY